MCMMLMSVRRREAENVPTGKDQISQDASECVRVRQRSLHDIQITKEEADLAVSSVTERKGYEECLPM